MKILTYDTETTGKPLWNDPSEDPRQPYIVQLAAILSDENRNIFGSLNVMIHPEGWVSDEEALRVHGIDALTASTWGVRQAVAVDMFLDMAFKADLRVGFSETFDRRLIRIALKRLGNEADAEGFWKEMKSYDVMWEAKKHFGWPSQKTLADTYAHFFGKPHEKQHSAMGDCRATLDMYYELEHQKAVLAGASGEGPAAA